MGTSTTKNNLWRGVLIEESLEDPTVLKKMNIVETQRTLLENETKEQQLQFHKIEVSD